jgi:sec-independent protein translocase protein TatC
MSDGEDESDADEGFENPGFDPPETPDRETEIVDHGASSVGPDATTTPPTSGAPGDEEMPLAVHIEEMIKRLSIVLIVAGGIAAVAFPFGEEVINFLWYSVLPGSAPPVLYKPLELLLTQMKVASLIGLIAALPVFVYETYLFMRPGLYPHERRYYLAAIPTSLVLAFVGLTFAYFIVIPAVFTYFLEYTEQTARVAFAIGQTMDLILILMAYLAVVFQIPLFVMLAMMMGLVTREWLVGRRILFWGAFAGISFIFSPDPTGMSPILIALTMIVLFEGTLLLAKWTGRGKRSGWS